MSGEVPSGWTLRPLLEVVELPSGQIDPRVEPYRSMTLIAPDHLESATGRLLGSQTAAEQGASSGKYLFARGDVVYSKIRPYLRKAYLASGGGICSADMYPLRPTAQVSSSFLLSALLGEHFSAFAATVSQRSGIPKVNREELAEYKLRLPPLPEQRRIAEILDTLDEAIRKTEQVIAKLQQMKQGLLHDLLTRGIDENGELRDPLRQPEQFKDSPLGRIPKEWEVGPFERLAASVDPQPDHRTPPHVADGIPYVGVGDFVSDTLLDLARCRRVSESAARKQEARFRLEEGDIIFGKIGTIGRPRLLPMGDRIALSANVILVKPRADASFVLTLLDSPYVREYIGLASHTTSQPAFGIQKIRAMHVAIPPADEQLCLGKILRSHGTCMSSEVTRLSKLRLLKQGLMDDLLTGRVRVKVTEAAE